MCVANKSEDLKYQTQQFLNYNLKTPERFKTCDEFKDILSVSTLYTKLFCERICKVCTNFQNCQVNKVLFRTTQPAHVIMIIAVVFMSYIWQPQRVETSIRSKFLNFIYLGAFSMYLGSQFWMTFVSGLSLYFTLPRHHFGQVQRVLFPKYFTINSILTFIILYVFTRRTQDLNGVILEQAVSLSLSFFINLVIRLYLTPPLLKYMLIKKNIETTVGLGMEIGSTDFGLLRNCPHYLKIHKLFRRVHMAIATGNILTMGCTVYHLYYLSNALCFV